MLVKLYPYKNKFSKEAKTLLPKHLWKFLFDMIDINNSDIIVSVFEHSKFSIKLSQEGWLKGHQSKDMVYDKNELVGVQYKISKDFFDIEDIETFEKYCNGDTF